MRNFRILSLEEDSISYTWTLVLQAAQNFLITIQQESNLEERLPNYSGEDICNKVRVFSYQNSNVNFAYEIFLHCALGAAGVQSYSIAVQVFEDPDNLEILEVLLFAFNSILGTKFCTEKVSDHMILKSDDKIIYETIA